MESRMRNGRLRRLVLGGCVACAACVACGGKALYSTPSGTQVGSGGDGAIATAGQSNNSGANGFAVGGTSTGGELGTVGTSGAGAAATGGAAGSGGVPGSSTLRKLTRVIADGPWQLGQQTTGIAVDSQGRLFINDEHNVYAVSGTSSTVFLTTADVTGISDQTLGFQDLDIGPDDQLYIAFGRAILRTDTAHQATPWRDLSTTYPALSAENLGVFATGGVAFAIGDGLVRVTSSDATLIYPASSVVDWQEGCAGEDLSVARSGVFLYQTGCNAFPLVRGNVDGSGVEVLYKTELLGHSPLAANNFLCSARDPKGGFYVVADTSTSDDVADTRRTLYHLSEDSDQTSGIERIDTTPTFTEALVEAQQSDVFAFDYCAIAGAPDGSVYLVTFSELWRVDPG